VRSTLIHHSPYKFEAPWSAWEFAYHILHKQANLVILSMAWLTREDARSYTRTPKDPDMDTLSYWLARLEPIIRAEDVGEIIVVLANRCGVEEEAVYAGTSCVIGIDGGEVKLYGVLGRGERELLVVDTTKPPQAKLISEPQVDAATNEAQTKDARNNELLPNGTGKPHSIPPPPLSPLAMSTRGAAPSIEPVSPENNSLSIDEILGATIPVSPVEPMHSHHYFADEKPDVADLLARLQSSTAHLKSHSNHPTPRKETPKPMDRSETPVDARPSSPKSRNASRTRMHHPQEPALHNHDLATHELSTESEFIAIIDLGTNDIEINPSPQGSPHASQGSHGSQEPQPSPPVEDKVDLSSQGPKDSPPVEDKVNPHSASEAVPHGIWDKNTPGLKPRQDSMSSRPRSTGW
jgi:protein N-terminal amidase